MSTTTTGPIWADAQYQARLDEANAFAHIMVNLGEYSFTSEEVAEYFDNVAFNAKWEAIGRVSSRIDPGDDEDEQRPETDILGGAR